MNKANPCMKSVMSSGSQNAGGKCDLRRSRSYRCSRNKRRTAVSESAVRPRAACPLCCEAKTELIQTAGLVAGRLGSRGLVRLRIYVSVGSRTEIHRIAILMNGSAQGIGPANLKRYRLTTESADRDKRKNGIARGRPPSPVQAFLVMCWARKNIPRTGSAIQHK